MALVRNAYGPGFHAAPKHSASSVQPYTGKKISFVQSATNAQVKDKIRRDNFITAYDYYIRRIAEIREAYLSIFEKSISAKINSLKAEKAAAAVAAVAKRGAIRQAIIDEALEIKDKTELLSLLATKGYEHPKSNWTTGLFKALNMTRSANNAKKNVMSKFLAYFDAKKISEIVPEDNDKMAQIAAEEREITLKKSSEGELFNEAYIAAINNPEFICDEAKGVAFCNSVKQIVELIKSFLTSINIPSYATAIQMGEAYKKDKQEEDDAYARLADNGYQPMYGGKRQSRRSSGSRRSKSRSSSRLNRRTKSNSR